jgi:hypothetical protein
MIVEPDPMIVRRIRPEKGRPALMIMETRSESERQPPLYGSMSMISTAILLPFGAL